MCGIAGTYGFDPTGVAEVLCERLRHRGPDASGSFVHHDVVLAHTRLSIIDLTQAASQPIHSACGRYVMVYNGEVYNFTELAAEIRKEKPDLTFKCRSDSEVVLEAFVLWGEDFVNRLNGMFAFAIYDKQEEKLFLFRDRLGKKPLYYFQQGKKFAFASELKALTALPLDKGGYSHEAIRAYLHMGYIPEPFSIWQNIHKFPKASMGILSGSELTIKPYWNPERAIRSERSPLTTQMEQNFESLLKDAVKKRLISDVPFGTFLSGGTDSSLITALAASVSDKPINTFTIGFEDKEKDESLFASEIARFLGTKHETLFATEKDALKLVPDILDCYDEPYADSSAIPSMLVAGLARKHVTMALTGDGGDELFLGYGAHLWSERLSGGAYKMFKQPLSYMFSRGTSRYKRISELLKLNEKTHFSAHLFSQEQYLLSAIEAEAILNPLFRGSIPLYPLPPYTSILSPAERQAFYDLVTYLPDDLLVKMDRASMRNSLETRAPLLDYRIVESALGMPYEAKINGGTTKYLLKKILNKYVPKELTERPKKGFSVPMSRWLKGPLNEMLHHYLAPETLKKSGIMDEKRVGEYFRRFEQGYDYYYNRLWQIMILQMFLEKNEQ
ncbi:MAG: asparagine synthase (glutamine-hydrolyzing) [Bacteroidetes bacterium HGW-Bacteroidetes-21]|jgi:asparagine synthase (glutamine-hydrolysing)|nr:MAG: asparagine synthase (glutamine-hydrolyzing) [Bacteroidetes bacterium HGW-Bacteroidetes-21]